MSDTTWTQLDNIDTQCFACGTKNMYGLNMRFESDGEKLRSRVTVPSYLRGWSNLVHGGILSTILDEIMSWSAIHLLQHFILTQEMSVRFKKKVLIETPLVAYGTVLERKGKRKALMKAQIFDEGDKLCVEGDGEFVLVSPKVFARLNIIPENEIEKLKGMFA